MPRPCPRGSSREGRGRASRGGPPSRRPLPGDADPISALTGLTIACATVTLATPGTAAAAGLPSASVPSAAPPSAPAPSAGTDTLRLTDDLGHELLLARPAARVVSLIPAATEILFAIGAGDRLVGRSRYDLHPPAAADVASVGEAMRPATELVVARRPDLVLVYASAANLGAMEELRRAGLRVLALAHDDLADLSRNIRRLGRVTGCPAAGRALAERVERDLARVAAATAGRGRPFVYYDVWSDPPITIGQGSYLDSLMAVAGGRNAFGELRAASPRVSVEAIVARDPDLVLFPVADGEERTAPTERPGWRAIGAVREGRVRRVDADLVHRLGPRVAEAAAALAEAIHPGAAGDLALGTGVAGAAKPLACGAP